MLRNHVKIFLSQAIRHKLHALINVTGLAAGLACCLFIALFVGHEFRYDSFFRHASNTYRLSFHVAMPDGPLSTNSVPAPLGPLLQTSSPQVSMVTRMDKRAARLQHGEALYREENFNLVDKNFFSVFDVDWLQGSAALAFTSPNAVVLTKSMATQYFGRRDPLGSTLLMDDDVVLTVTGVIADFPSNTHLTGRAFASFDLLEVLMDDPSAYLDEWWGRGAHTYVVLAPEASVSDLETLLGNLLEQYVDIPPWLPSGTVLAFQAIPLTDIHMKSRNMDELRPGGSPTIVYAFIAIGVGMLAIAGVNFVNITTARASRRAREVGVRKVLGATRRDLALQFIAEALLLCVLAMLLALACVELLMPTLNALLGIELRAGLGSAGTASLYVVLATLGIGLMAGWYPSLYLSAFRPAAVLKGTAPAGQSGMAFRGVLVMLQFAVVIVLMVAAAVIQLQLRHTSRMDLGFQRENVIVINASGVNLGNQYGAFRDTLLQSGAVISVAASDASPLRDVQQSLSTFQAEGDSIPRNMPLMRVDAGYFDTYAIRLLAGRFFSTESSSDFTRGGIGSAPGAVVVNETTARVFGWTPASAVGQVVRQGDFEYAVIGVVADTVEHARLQANPMLYFMPDTAMAGEVVSVRVTEGRAAEALAYIDATWKAFSPRDPLRSSFLDDTIDVLYVQDSRQLQLSFLFSGLAILIACMGLYGLVAFNAECRTREIGVRKVMGGSVWSIVLLLTNDFSKLVLLSNLIAWPAAYFAMNRWLENFAYRIDLTPLVFIGSGLIALCIAWVTVGGTAAKAASARPVSALRYE